MTSQVHDHAHDEALHHDHDHRVGLHSRLRELVAPHTHDAGNAVDVELEASQRGIRVLIISFAGLGLTAILQAIVVGLSGSVGLLGDTLHNFADALTAVPLAIAFTLGRRAATQRFTYGYGRSEDLAGVIVVVLILASSAAAAAVSISRLLHPQALAYLPLVAVASIVGFAGKEIVARYRIQVGREIGSAALVADGLHARTDGLTSLAVLVGAGGVALGFRLADPIVGLVITVTILVVLRQAAKQIFARLMDAVDPVIVAQAEAVLRETPGVLGVGAVRLRWIGHALHAECEIVVAPPLTVVEAHEVAESAQHELLHRVHRLTSVVVHADPQAVDGFDHHTLSAHHRPPVSGSQPTGV
jgi:cation diffusion facilitator family transporter